MLTVIPFSQRGNGGVRPKSLSYQHRTQGHLKPTSVHPLTAFFHLLSLQMHAVFGLDLGGRGSYVEG